MSRNRIVLSTVVLVLFAASAAAGEFNKVLSIGDAAPDFSDVPAIFQEKETALKLADIKEDVVVLVFLANHCPYVVSNEERLNKFTEDYKDKSVKVVGLSVSLEEADTLPAITKYVEKHKSAYVYGYDATQNVGRAYGAANTPQYIVLDKARKVRYMGAMDDVPTVSATKKPTKHYLRDAVDALLKGEKPPVEETRQVGCGIQYKRN